MKQGKKRIRLEISVDSPDTMELVYALSRVIDQLRAPCPTGRLRINDTTVDLEYSTYGEIDYRIEQINGKLCYIYKSRMNEK